MSRAPTARQASTERTRREEFLAAAARLFERRQLTTSAGERMRLTRPARR